MTNTLKRIPVVALTVIVLVAALFSALAVSQAQAALRHFDGTVLSKNSDSRTFRIETEQGRNVKFRVNRSTEFERIQVASAASIAGFASRSTPSAPTTGCSPVRSRSTIAVAAVAAATRRAVHRLSMESQRRESK